MDVFELLMPVLVENASLHVASQQGPYTVHIAGSSLDWGLGAREVQYLAFYLHPDETADDFIGGIAIRSHLSDLAVWLGENDFDNVADWRPA